jgi:hypothetical protein
VSLGPLLLSGTLVDNVSLRCADAQSCQVERGGKSALDQAAVIAGVILAFNITQLVVGIVSDGASDITKASRLLPYFHSICFVHTVANVIKDAACLLESEIAPLRAVIKRFRASNKLKLAADAWVGDAGFDLTDPSPEGEISSIDCLLFGLRQTRKDGTCHIYIRCFSSPTSSVVRVV